jgi:hypothetical protein
LESGVSPDPADRNLTRDAELKMADRSISNAGPASSHHGYRERLLDAVAAISLANLCFINIWAELVDRSSADFLRKAPFFRPLLGITSANVLLLAIILFAGMSIRARLSGKTRTLADVAFLAVLAVPVNLVRTKLLFLELGFLKSMLFAPLILLAAAAIWWRAGLTRIARHVLVLLFPLLPLCCVQMWIAHSRRLDAEEFSRTLDRPRLHAGERRATRAIWMIFDELDYCLAFPNRSPNVKLPELDRLQASAVYGVQASSPGPNTIEAIPGLLTGRAVQEGSPNEISELRIKYSSEKTYHLLTKEPNVFRKAEYEGLNVAVDGWFLPYCRLFPLTACQWEPVTSVFLRENYERYVSFLDGMWLQVEGQLVSVPGVHTVRSSVGSPAWAKLAKARKASREHSILEYKRIHAAAMRLLDDPELDLVFLHWPAPHPLFYYDRASGNFTSRDGPNYFDGLALVDRTLAEVRHELEASGHWNDAVLLVSGDHPLRANALRGAGLWTQEEQRAVGNTDCAYVPFLLKLPNQQAPVRYDRPFNTALSGELLLSILRRDVTTPDAAAQWIDQHSHSGEGEAQHASQ